MLDTATQSLVDDLDLLVAQDPHDLPDALILESTQALLREKRRLDGVLSRRLQVMDTRGVTTNECGRSTRAWLVEEQLLSQPDASGRMRVARGSVIRPAVADALLAGEINHDHARLTMNFLAKIAEPQTRDLAEKELLEACTFTDPTELAKNVRELEDRLCLNETAEERAVRRREGAYLNLTDTIDQMVALTGMLDREQATIVRTALYPLSLKAGEVDERSHGQRRADALTELANMAIKSGKLPETAGEPTQLVVTTPLSDLLAHLEAGDTSNATLNGVPITPNTARMHACDAGVIPAVLGGNSEVLDLGRATRTWTRAQRKAAKIRAHGHCEAPLCQAAIDLPPLSRTPSLRR